MAVDIESHLNEQRVFAPPEEVARRARVKSMKEYERLHQEALADPERFWCERARALDWLTPWERWFERESPFVRFFVGGKLNLAANCLDRHLATRGDKRALVWEGEPGDERSYTYRELHAEVGRLTNGLKELG